MLRLAEQCDSKEWYINLAEQNWRTWPPLRAEQDYILAERNCWPPLKNAPRTPMVLNVKAPKGAVASYQENVLEGAFSTLNCAIVCFQL